jgi:hypothetical protein
MFLFLAPLIFTLINFVSSSWLNDNGFQFANATHCDFHVYDAAEGFTIPTTSLERPFVVRNLANSWPAINKWNKDVFLATYGHKTVRSGSESSIVHSGGVAEVKTTLNELIAQMNDRMSNLTLGGSFVFDTTILSAIPELIDDVIIPDIFQSWDNKDAESRSVLWHMLSLGPSRSGTVRYSKPYYCYHYIICLLGHSTVRVQG